MSNYKVIQDIEAEDKLFGPFSLRQFIYASIAAVCLYLSFFVITKGLPFLVALLLPPAALFGILAWPWSPIQSNEVWLLAKLRFYFKPKRRIWDQGGIKNLVTINVPKKAEEHLVKDMTQSQVKSRLKALANTIDSRGWALKNVDVNLFTPPALAGNLSSDRLIGVAGLPQDPVVADVGAVDDIFDENNNPTAQNLDRMIVSASQNRKNALLAQMQQQTAPKAQTRPRNNDDEVKPDYWFMYDNTSVPQKGGYAMMSPKVVMSGPAGQARDKSSQTAKDQQLLNKTEPDEKKKKTEVYSHMRTIKPLSEQAKEKRTKKKSPPPVTPPPNPAILELVNNDDLNVATIARQANKQNQSDSPDEVVISLH